MTDLRTEQADAIVFNYGIKRPIAEMIAENAIDRVNKRWVDWLKACGLEVDHWGSWGIDAVIKRLHKGDNLKELVGKPELDDPNRFSPLSRKE